MRKLGGLPREYYLEPDSANFFFSDERGSNHTEYERIDSGSSGGKD